jgi:selenium metabolism protein YedF
MANTKVFLIQSDTLGRGDEQLGLMLMGNLLRVLAESPDKPQSVIFINNGVKLVCRGSHVIENIKKLEQQGVKLLACGTCLEYFDLKDKMEAGQPTTMARTIETLLSQDIVCL